MQLTIRDHTKFFENAPTLGQCMSYIEEYTSKHDLIIQYLIFDGRAIHERFEDTFIEMGPIDQFEVVTQTVIEAKQELKLQMQQYLKRAIPLIQSLSEQFCTAPEAKSWSSLNELLEAIEWLLNSRAYSTADFVVTVDSLAELLESLHIAMTNSDYGLISDILQYELVDIFNQLLKVLEREQEEVKK
ncbi:hypothetical protein ACFFNY_33355 [Paenibacillus hodogayensis]|uniref:Uncharacterized protein n=1 Tax=Paenibacillus hodogayensis TaxID=279208 RepID=A0ABV5W7E4_9BACL